MKELVADLKKFFEKNPYGTFHIEGDFSEKEIQSIEDEIKKNKFPCSIHYTVKATLKRGPVPGYQDTFIKIYKVKITMEHNTGTSE